MSKQVTAFLLNLQSHHYDVGIQVLKHMLHKKIWNQRKTELAAVLLLGTKDTRNVLHDEQEEGYEYFTHLNYSSASPVTKYYENVTPEWIRSILSLSSDKIYPADPMDGFIYALHLLHQQFPQKKPTFKIILITEPNPRMNLDDYEIVLQGLVNVDAALTVIVLPDAKNSQKLNPSLEKIISDVQGSVFSSHEALKELAKPDIKKVKPVTVYRGDLSLNVDVSKAQEIPMTEASTDSELRIKIHIYNKTSLAKPLSAKKYNSRAKLDKSVTFEHQYFIKQDQQDTNADEKELERIEKENTTLGIVYGRRIIDFHEEDARMWKLETFKSFAILYFVGIDDIPRHYLMDGVKMIVPEPHNDHAKALFTALMFSMMQKNVAAVIRYCRVNDAPPKLGVMICSLKGHGLFCQIPFKEDIQSFGNHEFASFNVKKTSQEASMKVKNLIESKTMSEEQEREWEPKRVLNPLIQRQQEWIADRACTTVGKM